MNNQRLYLAIALLCGIVFLVVTPISVRLLRDLGFKEDTSFLAIASMLPELFQLSPVTSVLLSLWLLLPVLFIGALILAFVSRRGTPPE